MVRIIETDYDNLSLKSVGDWPGFPDLKGADVFLKPNLVSPKTRWDSCSTTDVRVVDLVIQKLKEVGAARIVIGECGFKDQWEATMISTGYDRLKERYPDVEIIPLQDGENFHKFTLCRLEKHRSLFGARFSNYMLECDAVINIPKMKMHCMAGITGAIKNMMGCMIQKGSMHPRANKAVLHNRLVDLYYLTRSRVKYVVMDGIEGSEYAEQCGRPRQSNALLLGTDQWEIDVHAAILMGIRPMHIPYLCYIRNNFPKYIGSPIPIRRVQRYERPLHYHFV